MGKNALVPIADGTEEIEAVCIIDVLRRAGVTVTVASVGKTAQITGSRGVRIVADAMIDQVTGQTFDVIALPGGGQGSQNLARSQTLLTLLKTQRQSGRWVAAVCAAPAVVLLAHGLLHGVRATSHPSFHSQFNPSWLSKDPVVIDGNVITGQGAGVAIEFALTLVEQLAGPAKRQEVAGAMVVPGA
jgi:4-methyl-5(b-hydroxyethyl)-thiazole monophosphate biosynthesis